MAPQKSKKSFFNKTLALRLISTLVLIPAVVWLVLQGGEYFEGLLMAAAFVMGYEWPRLTRLNVLQRYLMTAAVVATMWWLLVMNQPVGFEDAIKAAFVAGGLFGALALLFQKESLSWLGVGLIYIPVPLFSLAWASLAPEGAYWILWLFALIWATDSGAYLAGRLIGGPKLAPKTSPNKTWAGAIGGLAAGIAAGFYLGNFFGLSAAFPLALGAALLSTWGQIGDLAESAIKRQFGVKDTGSIIPGQGGMLDRADSLVFASPLLALGLNYFGNF